LAWKITKEYWRHHRDYDKWVKAVEEMLQKTDSPHAHWSIVEANDMQLVHIGSVEEPEGRSNRVFIYEVRQA
jgi:polyphosphate kinase 2 (PPK2 family)